MKLHYRDRLADALYAAGVLVLFVTALLLHWVAGAVFASLILMGTAQRRKQLDPETVARVWAECRGFDGWTDMSPREQHNETCFAKHFIKRIKNYGRA